MGYLKHNANGDNGKRPKKNRSKPLVEEASITDLENAKAGLVESEANTYRMGDSHSGCMEEAIDRLRSVFSTWVGRELDGDNGQPLYSSPNGYPVRVTLVEPDDITVSLFLEGNAVESIADSLKRIADALTGHASERNGTPSEKS